MSPQMIPSPMQMRQFSLSSPEIKPGELLLAIETAIAPEAIDQTIHQTNSQQQRNRRLPTHLVVALVITMSLWSKDAITDVLKNLVDGLSTFA